MCTFPGNAVLNLVQNSSTFAWGTRFFALFMGSGAVAFEGASARQSIVRIAAMFTQRQFDDGFISPSQMYIDTANDLYNSKPELRNSCS